MIPYIEIIDKYTLKRFAMIEPQECWFELSYYDVGQFEIYCRATPKNIAALQKGQFVKLPNKRFAWLIDNITYTTTANHTRMISAKGYEAKWLLNKRIIRTPVELPSSLATAAYNLVYYNLGAGAGTTRRISGFNVELSTVTASISSQQAPRGNLLTFTNALLKTANFGSQVVYESGALIYKLLKGSDKTASVTFSESLDNLLESSYYTSDNQKGNAIMVASKVNDIDYIVESSQTGSTGVDRCEVYLSSNLATKYEDTQGEEQELDLTNATDLATYNGWLLQEGNKELAANHKVIEDVDGVIDLLNSKYVFDNDFYIGDIVKIRDDYFNFSVNKTILKYTIKQDAKGYGEQAEYGD